LEDPALVEEDDIPLIKEQDIFLVTEEHIILCNNVDMFFSCTGRIHGSDPETKHRSFLDKEVVLFQKGHCSFLERTLFFPRKDIVRFQKGHIFLSNKKTCLRCLTTIHVFFVNKKTCLVVEKADMSSCWTRRHVFLLDKNTCHVSCGFCQYLGNLAVIRAGGTQVQGLGEPAAHAGATTGPEYLKAFLIRESKNPYRQA